MSEKKYPIGGYAPGNYQCHCGTCGGGFIGDKRAYQCKPCAVRDFEKFDALSPTEQDELMKRNAAVIREMFSKWSNKPNMSEQLTPGPPTATGTYFAVIRCYVSDEPQMCVLHYQAHKNIYRAVGHAFNVEVKAEDVVGYVGEVKEQTGAMPPSKEDDRLEFSIQRGDLWKLRAISAELQLEELNGQPGAVWVKAKTRLPGWKVKVKWRDGNNHSYATDGKISFFEMEKPNLEGWEWLDESATPAAGREEDAVIKEVIDFIRDIATNWDCDSDGHKYDTGCRKCEAKKLYRLFKQQKEK